jgi:O-antigen/teichoic acid export membrane protein
VGVIRKNIAWLLISQVLTWVLTLVVLAKIPALLSDEELGTLAATVGYVGFFTVIGGLGSSTFLAREIVRDHRVAGAYVFNAVVMKCVLAAMLSVIAIGLAMLLGNRGDTLLLIVIGCAGMFVMVISEVFGGSLGGMERLAKPAMWTVVQAYVHGLLGLLVVAVLGMGVIAYGVVTTFAVLIPTVACGVMVWPVVRGHMRLDFRLWRQMLFGGIPLMALALCNLIYGTVDTPILHEMAGPRDVAWYAVGQRWAGLPIFVATAVMAAYFPAFSAHGNPVTPQYAPLVNRAIRLVALATIPAAVGLALVSADVLQLAYHHKYDEAIPVMVILALNIPLIALDSVLASALIAARRTSRYIMVAVIAAVINPIGCIVLINVTMDRYGNGAIGASIMTVATESIVLAGALKFRLPGVLDRRTVENLARIVVATTAMVPFVLLANDLPVPFQIAVGAASYAVAAMALRAVGGDEVRAGIGQVAGIVGRFNPLRKAPDAGEPEADDQAAAGPSLDSAVRSEI